MSRRRSTPWIHRQSRPLLGAIAFLGVLDTAYLTLIEWGAISEAAFCPTSGVINCNAVLASDYAKVFGIPLSLFGFLAYAGIASLALVPLLVNPQEKKDLRSKLENWTWLGLFGGSIAMLFFSGYLVYLMAFQIKAFCIYCLASAVFSIALFVITLIGRTWEDLGQLFFIGILVGMVSLIGTMGVYASSARSPASGQAEIALAEHLTQQKAKMYGAFWCPHCQDQKKMFGTEAFGKVDYVECDPSGEKARPELCQAANIKGYPTWEIKGKLHEGIQTLDKLAELSAYGGSRDFKKLTPAH